MTGGNGDGAASRRDIGPFPTRGRRTMRREVAKLGSRTPWAKASVLVRHASWKPCQLCLFCQGESQVLLLEQDPLILIVSRVLSISLVRRGRRRP